MQDDFKEVVLARIDPKISTKIIIQELDDLPHELNPPEQRNKPWGTAHAVWACRDIVNKPFAIANADDFYGSISLEIMGQHLSKLSQKELSACMVGFELEKTLSAHGSVSRGICKMDDNGHLISIKERTKISKEDDQIFYEEDGISYYLTGKETASMNLIGFTPLVFSIIEEGLISFYRENKKDLQAEYYVPEVLQKLIHIGVEVPVLPTPSQWFGVTYREDKKNVQEKLLKQHRQGTYPSSLVQ